MTTATTPGSNDDLADCGLDHLIIVCCHAIYFGDEKIDSGSGNDITENGWLIQPFQKGETPTYIDHIKAGLGVHDEADGKAMLVFSGAATKRHQTSIAEGESYYAYAQAHNLLPTSPNLLSTITHDPHAYITYQNILYPLLQFRLRTGLYPKRITIISHAFKQDRIMNLHLSALRLNTPASKIRTDFIGINPPKELTPWSVLEKAEFEKGFVKWRDDLYGFGDYLGPLRIGRGEVEVQEGGEWWAGRGLEDAVEQLARWRGGEDGKQIFEEKMPWEA